MKINGENLSVLNDKKAKKTLLKLMIIFIIIVTMFFLSEFFFIFKMRSDYYFNQEILENGQKYEKSIYIKYKDKIYAYVYGESYQLENVDIESFKVIDSMEYFDSHVAVDKKLVYFGNIPIPDLNPNKIENIGNGYYSDGINSYFCSNIFEKDKDLSEKSKIRQYIEYYIFKGKKPQEYSYSFKKVETNKILKIIKNLDSFATDGEKVYYQGEVLENADFNTLKNVGGYNEYFFDKKNIYYKSKLLPLPSNDKLKIVSVEQEERKYLFDGLNGNVFLEGDAFEKYGPYQVLGEKSNHIKDLLFVSRDGIFFYNPEKKEQERAGDNIFIGKIQEINPSVISDDKNIYYLHSYDIFRKKRTKHGYMNILVSKNIGIFYLGKKKDWEKIKDIEYGTTGEIWKKDNKYYYFDNLGLYQLIDDVIYEITDNASLKYLLETNNINDNDIRELIKNKKLVVVNGKEIITASIKYKESHRTEIFLIAFSILIITIVSLILYLKWKKMKLEVKEIEEEIKKQNKKIEPLIRYCNDKEEK